VVEAPDEVGVKAGGVEGLLLEGRGVDAEAEVVKAHARDEGNVGIIGLSGGVMRGVVVGRL
jgi:hypothetical protein